MPTIIDGLVIIILALGAIIGFQEGIIKSASSFLGLILIIVGSYFLKNHVSTLLYTNLPFFEFKGAYEGISVLNILIYEAIAYLLVFLILWGVLRVVIVLTGILEAILKMTIILSLPTKLLGLIFGLCSSFLIVYISVFCYNQFTLGDNELHKTDLAQKILNETPVLSSYVGDAYDEINQVIEKIKVSKDTEDKEQYNKELFEIMLDKKFIKIDSAEKLIKKEKIKIKDATEIIAKYKEEQ